MQHVLSTTTSASCGEAARDNPSATRRPAMRSESCSFIWHPKVRTKYVRAMALSSLGLGRAGRTGLAWPGAPGGAPRCPCCSEGRHPAPLVEREARVEGHLPQVAFGIGEVP